VVYEAPYAFEEAVILDTPRDLDEWFVPPPEVVVPKSPGAGMTMYEFPSDPYWDADRSSGDAGDIFPTFVSPDDAKRYMGEVDAGYTQLDASIQSFATAPSDFKASWGIQLGAWKTFYATATATVGWLNTKAVMDQTDRFNTSLGDWRKQFQAIGGSPPGPAPLSSGQGVPGPASVDLTKTAIVVGGLFALIIFGPTLLRTFNR
jgi:hypothetical protein